MLNGNPKPNIGMGQPRRHPVLIGCTHVNVISTDDPVNVDSVFFFFFFVDRAEFLFIKAGREREGVSYFTCVGAGMK